VEWIFLDQDMSKWQAVMKFCGGLLD